MNSNQIEKPTARLRRLIERPGILRVPGSHNAFTARIIVQAGFEAVYMTGSGTATALTGLPDIGLLTLTEMVMNARFIAKAVHPLPVISDADTGYGNAINVMRTVQEFEQAEVAGIHIEDQEFPKRCGHMSGKRVIPLREMVGKIEAAVTARSDPDFVIIARTDARAPLGIAEAVRRGIAYHEAGADIIFPEAPQSREELIQFAREIPAPLLANSAEWGRTPLFSADELEEMGYKIVIFPVSALRVAQNAISDLMSELREKGTQKHLLDRMKTRQELYDLVDLERYNRLQDRYLPDGTILAESPHENTTNDIV